MTTTALTTSLKKVAYTNMSGVSGSTLEIWAKYNSQSVSDNSSSVYVEMRIVNVSGTSFHCYTHSANFTGAFSNSTSVGSYYHGWESSTTTTILTETKTIKHNDNGTKTFNIGGAFSCSAGVSGSLSSSSWECSLPTIARGFSTKPILEITSIQEQRVDFRWTTSENCNRIRFGYKLPSTSTFSWGEAVTISDEKTGTSYISTGLTAGTTYDFCVECRKSDSNLTMNSDSTQMSTYPYPTVKDIGVSSFTLPAPTGSSSQVYTQTIYLNNPLNRTGITVYARTVGTSTIKTWTKSSVSGTDTTIDLVINDLYMALGDEAKSGNIEYYCVYSGNTTTSLNDNFVTLKDNCCPTFSGNLTYANTNSAHVTLLGSDQYIIQGKSSVLIQGPTYSMRGNFGQIDHYELTWGGNNPVKIASPSINYTTVGDSEDVILKMVAVDKRGYSSEISQATMHVLKYETPSLELSMSRTGDYDDATGTISLIAKRSELKINNVEKNYWNADTTNHKITYSVTPTSSSLSSGGTINNTAAAINTSLSVTNLNPQLVYKVTFHIQDAITSSLDVAGTFDQAVGIYDFNIESPAIGIGVVVNKANVPSGLHAKGIYISEATGEIGASQLHTSTVSLGKSTGTVTSNGLANMVASQSQSNAIASKTGAATTSTAGNFSINIAENEKVNGELFIGGSSSTTKQGKIYLFNGSAYIPIIWYQKNN